MWWEEHQEEERADGCLADVFAFSRGRLRLLCCLQCERTPLHKAASSGNEQACKVLLEGGAEVNARDQVMGVFGVCGLDRERDG